MASDRDQTLDRLRGLLIALVVFGHLIEHDAAAPGLVQDVYRAIYLFHIPLFAGLAGYLTGAVRRPLAVVRGLLVPWLLAEIVYRALDALVFGQQVPVTDPYWILWFLLSLACWRLALPIWIARVPTPLMAAFALGLLAGGADWLGYPASAARTLCFFPFFVLGHVLAARGVTIARFEGRSVVAGLLLAAALTVAIWPFERFDVRLLYGSLPYAALGLGLTEGLLARAGHYLAALVLSAAVLSLVPRRGHMLAALGRRSMAVFLVHGAIVLALRQIGLPNGPAALALAVPLTLAICALRWPVASRPVRSGPSTRLPPRTSGSDPVPPTRASATDA